MKSKTVVLAMVYLTLTGLAAIAPTASAGPTPPTVGVPTAEVFHTYRTGDPGMPKSFTSGCGFQKIGNFLYVTTGAHQVGGGTIQYFKWDPNDGGGKITYVGSVDNSTLKAGFSLCAAGGRLYALGLYVWGAKDGDNFKGLAWYDIDKETGKPMEKGVLPTVIAGSWTEYMVAGPEGKDLYIYTQDRNLVRVKIGEDGTPEKAGQITGPGVGSNPAISPDGKNLYSIADHKLACIERKATGELVYKNAVSLNCLAATSQPNVANLSDYHSTVAGISPDGKWLYVGLWSENPRTMNVFGIFKRDPATGAVTLQAGGSAYTPKFSTPANLRNMKLLFLPDGSGGYIASDSDLVQSFRLDSATGELCDINCLNPSSGTSGRPGPLVALDAKAGLLFGTGAWQFEPYGYKTAGLWVAKAGTMQIHPGEATFLKATAAPADNKPGNELDWPAWRGPTGDNQSAAKGIRKDWAGGLKKVWEVSGLSPFVSTWSPPAVLGNKLVVLGKHGCLDEAVCFDADKGGEPLWVAELFGENGGDGWAGGPHPMPCIDGDKVYLCHGSRYACLSMQDGRLLWEKGFSTPGHAPGHPAYVWKDLAILTHCVMPEKGNRVELAAVKKDTGEVVWSYDEPRHLLSAGYSVPLCAKLNGQEQLLHNSGAFACGLDPLTGKQLWEFVASPKLAGEHGTTLSPLTDGSSVITFAAREKGDGLITSLQIENGEAKEAWVTDFTTTWSPPLIQNGLLFAFTPGAWGNPDNKSSFRCVDMKTGKTLWTEKNVSAGHIVGVDGKLLVLTFEGDLWLVEPAAEKFSKVAEWKGAIKPVPWWTGNGGKGPCPCWTMPTIARGKIYLRSSDRLVCYDLMAN